MYASALLTCHQKTAEAGAKGTVLDDESCESNPATGKGANEQFDAAIAKLATKCGGCMIANALGLRAALEAFVEDNNKLIYCAP